MRENCWQFGQGRRGVEAAADAGGVWRAACAPYRSRLVGRPWALQDGWKCTISQMAGIRSNHTVCGSALAAASRPSRHTIGRTPAPSRERSCLRSAAQSAHLLRDGATTTTARWPVFAGRTHRLAPRLPVGGSAAPSVARAESRCRCGMGEPSPPHLPCCARPDTENKAARAHRPAERHPSRTCGVSTPQVCYGCTDTTPPGSVPCRRRDRAVSFEPGSTSVCFVMRNPSLSLGLTARRVRSAARPSRSIWTC